MVYYNGGMELEVISRVFHGSANDVLICRNRLSPEGAAYTLLAVRERACVRALLSAVETPDWGGACLFQFSWNEETLFAFPFREERRLREFAPVQAASAEEAEAVCAGLVMECLSARLPWPLLYLVLEQGCVQLARDNTVYFTAALDLAALDPSRTERHCVCGCARMLLEILSPAAGRRGRLKSYQLIRKKSAKNAYTGFPELYRDLRAAGLPPERLRLTRRAELLWRRSRGPLFRGLLILCAALSALALALLASQLVFGEIPLLRLFRDGFAVIGTESLRRGGI